MTSDPTILSQLKHSFGSLTSFTTIDIKEFYTSQGLLLSAEALRSRIHRLTKMGLIQRVGHGIYQIGEQVIFIPTITPLTKKIYRAIHSQYPFANICIWHTSALNEFMVHQPFSFNLIVEVEKDAAESIFHFIKEKFKNVYLNPNAETYKNYIAGNTDSIIVKSMITESPLQEIYSVHAPSIEKILVDIYCDTNIYSAFQGKEMQNIYRNAVNDYTVNLSTLARYALRRGKKEEIGNYLSHLGIKVRNKTT